MIERKFLPSMAALLAFEAVGRLGGVRRAAKELMIDHAVVSRHVHALEAWTGIKLLERDGTSAYRLTALGLAYHAHIDEAIRNIASATSTLMTGEEKRRLCLWCIPGFASWLSDRIGDFVRVNSEVDVEFRPSDTAADFRDRDIDADIRYVHDWDELSLPRTVVRMEFARPMVLPVVSAHLAADLPRVESAADVMNLPLLHEDNDLEWRHWFMEQGVSPPERLPGTRLWHAPLALAAARAGHGVALSNCLLLGDDLEAGRLVEVKPGEGAFAPVRFGAYTFIAPRNRWTTAPVKHFRHWLQTVVPTPERSGA